MKRMVLGVLVLALVAALAFVPGCRGSARRSAATEPPAVAAPEPSGDHAVRGELEELQSRIALLEREREVAKGAPPEAAAAAAPVEPPAPDPAELLQNAEEEAARSAESSGAIADGYYEQGRGFANEWKLKEAKAALAKCLQLNPQHPQARQLMDMVRSNLGEFPESETGSRIRQIIDQAEVHQEQNRIEIENRFANGVKYYETEDFDKAIDDFQWVIELIKWNPPLDVEMRPRLAQTEGYLAKAREGKQRRDFEVQRQQEEAARLIAEKEEGSRLLQQAKEIDKRYDEAEDRIERREFAEAEGLADQILRIDPNNRKAHLLKEFAKAARHAQADDRNTRNWIEEWRQEMNAIDRKLITQSDPVVFPDVDVWKKIQDRQPRGIGRTDITLSAADLAVRNRMRATKISLAFTDAPLTDVVAFMREFTSLNILVDTRSIPTPADIRITLKVEELPFESVLSLIAKMHKLAYKIEDGVILIISEADLSKDTVLELYDVQDMTVTIPDFPGPELSLLPPAEGGGGGVGTTEVQQQQVTQEDLQKLIQNNIAKGTWETPPNSLTFSSGTLIVRHTPDVHAQIQKFLKEVRASTGMIVSIESRFLTVSKHFLQEIGVDWRGLPSPIRGKNSIITSVEPGLFTTGDSGIFHSGDAPVKARIENVLGNATRVATFFT
ncbi:MAG: hypothetical protein HZA54_13970, partial [Planctomycetes bacterium]|nr:hypothetical protein [Planctomycetota bacterium]